ncbi:MAG: hypothetical protein KAS23_06885, partial [Anaerohalosphaera sp.]|nr:hypothetical protein [Anaerohalosphaera sp.]
MYKRFLKYYVPHKKLFILTMTAAVLSSLCTIFIPPLTRYILNTHISESISSEAGDTDLSGMAVLL